MTAYDGAGGEHDGQPGVPATGWRRSAKALVVDPTGRLLLVGMRDPVEPELGDWWELPGGGVEGEETPEQACAREVAEETGLVVDPGDVGPALWRRRATFRWLGIRRWQDETVHVVRVPAHAATVALRPTEDENRSMLGTRWWTLAQVAGYPGRFYPGRLPELGPRVLRGERVEESFEWWS